MLPTWTRACPTSMEATARSATRKSLMQTATAWTASTLSAASAGQTTSLKKSDLAIKALMPVACRAGATWKCSTVHLSGTWHLALRTKRHTGSGCASHSLMRIRTSSGALTFSVSTAARDKINLEFFRKSHANVVPFSASCVEITLTSLVTAMLRRNG